MRLILPYILLVSHLFWSSTPIYREYEVLESSKIQIRGTSNVTEFKCNCDIKEIDAKIVKYEVKKGVQNFSTVKFPVKGFDCGGRLINRDFMELVKANEHPNLAIRLLDIYPINGQKARVNIEVEIAGKKNRYSTLVNYKKNTSHLEASGKFSLNIEDFKMEQPKKLMGLIVIHKEIDIAFTLNFKSVAVKELSVRI